MQSHSVEAKNPNNAGKAESHAMDGQGKDLSMVARTKRTDGRTRFFGSLTQLSLSSSSVGRISSYSPTEKVGSHNSCEWQQAQTKTQKEKKKKEERRKIKMRSRQVKSKEMMMNRLQRD